MAIGLIANGPKRMTHAMATFVMVMTVNPFPSRLFILEVRPERAPKASE